MSPCVGFTVLPLLLSLYLINDRGTFIFFGSCPPPLYYNRGANTSPAPCSTQNVWKMVKFFLKNGRNFYIACLYLQEYIQKKTCIFNIISFVRSQKVQILICILEDTFLSTSIRVTFKIKDQQFH